MKCRDWRGAAAEFARHIHWDFKGGADFDVCAIRLAVKMRRCFNHISPSPPFFFQFVVCALTHKSNWNARVLRDALRTNFLGDTSFEILISISFTNYISLVSRSEMDGSLVRGRGAWKRFCTFLVKVEKFPSQQDLTCWPPSL